MAPTRPSHRSASSGADAGAGELSPSALVRPHAGRLALVAVLSLAGSALVLVQPLLTRALIDDGLLARRLDVVVATAALLVAAALAATAVGGLDQWHYTKLSAAVLFRLRESVYRHLQRLSPEYFARVRPGDLLARLDGDVAEIQRFAVDRLLAAANGVLVLVGSVAVLIALSPSLALLAAVVLPLQVLVLRLVRPHVERRTRAVRGRSSDVTAFLVERLGAIKLVQSVAAEERESRRLGELNRLYLRDLLGLQLAGFAAGTGPALLLSVTTAAVFVVGGAQVVTGALSIGTLIAFSTYLARAAAPVQTLLGLTIASRRARVSLERILEITRERPAVEAPALPRPLPAGAGGEIRLERVRFRYAARDAWVLDGVDAAIAAGEKVALVGVSGVGKSTLLDLLHRHYDPHEGRLLLDGVDLRELDPGLLRRRVAVVAQDVILLAGSLAENVRYAAPEATDEGLARAIAAAGLEPLVARLPDGLATEIGPRGAALSGGERQRVAIARAVLQDPLVLVLDEATSAVDAATAARIASTVDRLFAGRTRVVVSHHPEPLAGADRVLELRDGVLVEHRRAPLGIAGSSS